MKNRNIKTGHTYQEYMKKFGKKFDDGKLEFVKIGEERSLNPKKIYWLIEDKKPGYYQITRFKVFFLPIIFVTAGSAAVATVITVPTVLFSNNNYSFTFNGTNCTLDNLSSYAPDTEVDLTLTAATGFELPNSLAVKISNEIKVAGTDYTYEKGNNNTASLKLTVTGNVIVDALAPENNLVLSFEVTPKSGKNKLGFAFQCANTPGKDDHASKSIRVNWGDETSDSTFNALANIDSMIAPKGFDQSPLDDTNGMWYYAGMSMAGYQPSELPDTDDFKRHEYGADKFGKTFTVKIYGDLNNIAFAFPDPETPVLYPWGTANDSIDNIITYRELPAQHISSRSTEVTQLKGIDLDQQVIFSSDSLTKATFALGTTKINNGCLCTSQKLESVSIPETVTEIGGTAFTRCKLKKVFIPASVTKIGYEAFFTHINQVNAGVQQLTEGVIFGDNSLLKEIGDNAFKSAGFTSFNLPDSVETLGKQVFAQCDKLSQINISQASSLKTIGESCFAQYDGAPVCTHPIVRDLFIPAGVTSIGDYAFEKWGFAITDGTSLLEQYIHILGCNSEADADAKFSGDNPEWRSNVRTGAPEVFVYGH